MSTSPAPSRVAVRSVRSPGLPGVELRLEEWGAGEVYLLLHGGAGPRSLRAFAQALSGNGNARVILPTHPGFDGTVRPAELSSVAQLAQLYVHWLEQSDLHNVMVIGNSIGGWVAAEIGALCSPRVRGVVLADATGIEVPGHPIAPVFSLSLDEVIDRSYFEPARFRVDLAGLPPAVRATAAANRETLAAYGGAPMFDPTLVERLGRGCSPTLVVWGGADRIVDPKYGRAYAAAIPGARFVLMPRSGHLPPLESPQEFLALIVGWQRKGVPSFP